jgi:hypothetical protein
MSIDGHIHQLLYFYFFGFKKMLALYSDNRWSLLSVVYIQHEESDESERVVVR